MVFLTLGDRFGIDDRGAPGAISGWGNPSWGLKRAQMGLVGPMKPVKVGARYFCGDCHGDEPVAMGNKFTSSKAEYQLAVTGHYTEDHPDLHYPIDQDGLDAMHAAKRKAAAQKVLAKDLKDLAAWDVSGVGGGVDVSGQYEPVTRPRELPDFTEFDFPDADVADGGAEEIELDQLISIAARQGRRLLGVELQNVDAEFGIETLTAPDNSDLAIRVSFALNTRTGAQNLDDPENLWLAAFETDIANVEATAGTGAAIVAQFESENDVIPGGVVYVAPRLFFRLTNNMDRQIDTGDLFARIATVTQPLSTFLLFELLEQYSGLFGFAA